MKVKNKIRIGMCVTIVIIWLITLFQSVSGTYIAKNNKNTRDTLKLYKDGSYYRTLYTKSSPKAMFCDKGNWSVEDNNLTLTNFYHDEDENYEGKVLNFNNVISNISFPIEHSFGRIVF